MPAYVRNVRFVLFTKTSIKKLKESEKRRLCAAQDLPKGPSMFDVHKPLFIIWIWIC